VQIQPSPDDVIIDLGCGTGSLIVRLAAAEPKARLIGLDPDPAVLDRARAKFDRTGARAELIQGFGRDAGRLLEGRGVTKVVSSLVFHQVPLAEKSAALNAAYSVLASGGALHIADYGFQRTALMRGLFRGTVQRLDGVKDTQPQADGILPDLIRQAGFIDVAETQVIPTPTGSISLFRATRQEVS
ncbi:MAG: class I SAM-dependent methyltransferase, partial [Caulobacterales bacterium]|nr:class I SAM-dependent methyltransferase [Caulobacterales bacterium]